MAGDADTVLVRSTSQSWSPLGSERPAKRDGFGGRVESVYINVTVARRSAESVYIM